jgi:hypothetical protein
MRMGTRSSLKKRMTIEVDTIRGAKRFEDAWVVSGPFSNRFRGV